MPIPANIIYRPPMRLRGLFKKVIPIFEKFLCVRQTALFLIISGHERRDLHFPRQSHGLRSINETLRTYDALQCPMIYCRWENGYDISQRMKNSTTGLDSGSVYAMKFYASRFMISRGLSSDERQDEPTAISQDHNRVLNNIRNEYNHILNCRELLNQYAADMYAKIESERLFLFEILRRNCVQIYTPLSMTIRKTMLIFDLFPRRIVTILSAEYLIKIDR